MQNYLEMDILGQQTRPSALPITPTKQCEGSGHSFIITPLVAETSMRMVEKVAMNEIYGIT